MAKATTQVITTPVGGTVAQVIGPVVDVQFEGTAPGIYNALELMVDGKKLTLEVQQQ